MSQEQMSFVVYKCKKMISPGVFFIFFNWFFSLLGVKEQKIAQNDKKTLSVMPYISGTIHYMIVIFGTYV